jgi:polar amino acid transport system substrate-binding protein
MKPLLSLAAGTLLALGLAAPALAQDLPDLGGRSIKAVTENAYYPLNFADPKTGEGIGLEYDVINEVAKRINAKVEWNLSSWDVMIQAVKDGQFDVGADGISITEERKSQIDYSDPFIVIDQFLLVRADDDRIKGQESFTENTDLFFGAQTGTSSFYSAAGIVGEGNEARIKSFDTFGAAVAALKAGDVDAVIVDQAASAGYQGADPGAFKTVGESLYSDPMGFIFTPGSDLVAPFNAGLAAMKADGTLDAMITRWFFDYGK